MYLKKSQLIFRNVYFLVIEYLINVILFMQKWLIMTHFMNAAQREIFFNIGQYFLVFWEKVVSIWSVFWEKVFSIVVSTDFFLQTTVVITGMIPS